ncbi:MAG TPA: penicillin-binding transpeptidase domain-containing protein [Pyrinomonadaceae bacterium]
MRANNLQAITVIQDVHTGSLLAFAASQPSVLDVKTSLRPLSLSKLLLAASWWDHRQPDASFDRLREADVRSPADRERISIQEMLVGGSDNAGREMAVALRRSVGTQAVLEDLRRYGFNLRANARQDDRFWEELSPSLTTRLITLAPTYVSLSKETSDADWAEALSLGEAEFNVTALHISRFLQAVGNDGMMLGPVALEEQVTSSTKQRRQPQSSTRIMEPGTARRLQSAMLDCVRRGTAKGIAQALKDTGWQIGGKTGSGPALLPKGAQVDGWFAGLIFDPQGKARFTVATFVRSGGNGGGNAAKISAELSRYIIGEQGVSSR